MSIIEQKIRTSYGTQLNSIQHMQYSVYLIPLLNIFLMRLKIYNSLVNFEQYSAECYSTFPTWQPGTENQYFQTVQIKIKGFL